jgi:GT2 family glycosyltransferase
VSETRGAAIVVLNADDLLHSGAVAALVAGLTESPDALAVYGEAVHIADDGRVLGRYPSRPFEPGALLESCYICQPAAAVRRSAFDAIGGMNPAFDVAMDYDFWIRLAERGPLRHNKTLARRGEVHREVARILRAHYGYVPYGWTYAYASWLLNRHDQFFEEPRAKLRAVLLSLPLGIARNPRHPFRYLGDWYAHRSLGRRR